MFELAKERVHAQSRMYEFASTDASPVRHPAGRPDGDDLGSLRTWNSGLPLTFRNGQPVTPEATLARSAKLGLKRAFDIVLTLAVLIVFAPVLLGVAFAIRVSSPGPVLFRQMREGLNGEPISVYKFRTMFIDRCDISGVTQTTSDDPRITRMGRFLRRTSIDELPQLFNVLKGEMSLIGPRPHAFGMLAAGVPYDRLVPYYAARQAMKPGISGWAQANGYRGPTHDAEKAWARIDHDLAYIENFSLLLDIKIIWMTLRREFLSGTGL